MDELLNAVRQAAGEGYTVYGELGREHDADVWYLARELAGGKLVAMRLYTEQIGPGGHKDYALEVAKELNASVSVGLAECPACGTPMRRWGRFCTRCGANLADSGQSASPTERENMLARVREEAGEVYEVLGEMPWSGGGAVFFALERASGRLVRLRIKSGAGGEALGETRALMPLGERVSVGYMTAMRPALQPAYPPFLKAAPPAPKAPTPVPAPPLSGPQIARPRAPDAPPPPAAIPPRPPSTPPRRPPKPPPKPRIDWHAPMSARERVLLGVIVVLTLAVAVAGYLLTR